MIVNQWVPAAHRGDAIGNSARRVRDLLRRMGHQSDVFAMTIDEDLRGDVRPFSEPGAREADAAIDGESAPMSLFDDPDAEAGGGFGEGERELSRFD